MCVEVTVLPWQRNTHTMQALLSRDPFAEYTDSSRREGGAEFDAALQGFLGSEAHYVPALPSPRGAASSVRDAFRGGRGDLDAAFEACARLQVRFSCALRVRHKTVSHSLCAFRPDTTHLISRKLSVC
jgi:hypothetical protein